MGSLLWISTMKVLLLSFLALLPLGLAIDCDEHCNACDGDADIAVITCTAESCEVTSKIPDGQEGFLDMNYLKNNLTIEDLTPEICRAKCQEQSEHGDGDGTKNCIFFHWQEAHVHNTEIRCSLQTECPPRSTCDPITKHCTSGQLGCNDDCIKVRPCSLTKATWTHDKFHVFCTDPRGHDINIYMDDFKDENIPDSTVCQTVRKCAAWNETSEDTGNNQYSRKLAVFCEGTNIGEDEKGTWTVMPNTGDQALSHAMITDEEGTTTGTITEQECLATCKNINLETYLTQWWADLICENPLVDNVLTPPNHCVLLCDNSLKKTIDCEYDVNGDKAWRDQDGTELKDETNFACN